jgi:hypothetical protein
MFSNSESEEDLTSSNILDDKGQVSYAIANNALIIRIEKPREIISRFSAMIYIFGYSYKEPFAKMPKIRIITKHDKFKILNGKKPIKPQGVFLDLASNALSLKIPLEVLGSPDFILTSVKAYMGKDHGTSLSVDASGFRKININ